MNLCAEIVDDVGAAERFAGEWDHLCELSALPYSSPHWLLPWWRQAAPVGSALRIVRVTRGQRLVAVAPFFARRNGVGVTGYQCLGAGTSPRVLPAAEHFDGNVAAAVAAALSRSDPSPVRLMLNGFPIEAPWADALIEAWPGRRPWSHADVLRPAPVVDLSSGFDRWLASRSRSFRQAAARDRRGLQENGGGFWMPTTPQDVGSALSLLFEFHRRRWASRGGSRVLFPGVEAMLRDSVPRLVALGRAHLWCVHLQGKTIAVLLGLSAGGEVSATLGGFDEDHARYYPSLQAIHEAIRWSCASGARRLDLNAGDQAYKRRYATAQEPLLWTTIVPRRRGYLRTRACLAPGYTARAVYTKLPDRARATLRTVAALRRRQKPARSDL